MRQIKPVSMAVHAYGSRKSSMFSPYCCAASIEVDEQGGGILEE